VTGRNCSVCSLRQVAEVDVLLATRTPVRQVARMFGLSRTTVGRHREHIAPTSKPFAVIRATDGPPGPPDPLAEAFLLAERARTPRERIRALEQVRAATRLRFRGVADLDADDHELLDGNIRAAEAAYRDAADFETAARALSGWREAIVQRLDAVKAKAPEGIDTQVLVVFTDLDGNTSEPAAVRDEPATFEMPPKTYFRGVPKRFHDVERYRVERMVFLSFTDEASEALKVYEIGTNALVWAKDTASSSNLGRE
jgi:hypothetical protein